MIPRQIQAPNRRITIKHHGLLDVLDVERHIHWTPVVTVQWSRFRGHSAALTWPLGASSAAIGIHNPFALTGHWRIRETGN